MTPFKLTFTLLASRKQGVTVSELRSLTGRKPTIVRTRSKRFESPGSERTDNFIKITYPREGAIQRVEYYIPTGMATPFHNLYRVVADPVSDYVTHRAA